MHKTEQILGKNWTKLYFQDDYIWPKIYILNYFYWIYYVIGSFKVFPFVSYMHLELMRYRKYVLSCNRSSHGSMVTQIFYAYLSCFMEKVIHFKTCTKKQYTKASILPLCQISYSIPSAGLVFLWRCSYFLKQMVIAGDLPRVHSVLDLKMPR